jgi:putative transposase
MPRKARVEFAGAAYHLLNRGDRREGIFRDERDREIFLTTLGQGQRTDRLAMVAGNGDATH